MTSSRKQPLARAALLMIVCLCPSHYSNAAFTSSRNILSGHDRNLNIHHQALNLDVEEKESLTYDKDGPRVTFKARKEAKVAVVEEGEEGVRTLLEYLALPAEKYSILDAGSIERIPDSNSFVCILDPINFLGNTIIAKIYADVNVSPYPEGKSVIEVTGCELDGSKLARFANGSFDVKCTNVVRALCEDYKQLKNAPVLAVDCNVKVSALVPREGKWIPKRLLSSSGSLVMKSMLKLMVPRFVSQLAADFQTWSLGDDSRAPVKSDLISDDGSVCEVAKDNTTIHA